MSNSGHAPQDPRYEQRVRDSFARQALMTTLGAELAEVAPGRVSIRLPFRKPNAQQHGFVHAGALASVADSACGYAALTLMPPGSGVLSIEFKVNMLSPATGGVIARGEVIRAGKTIMVCRADLYGMRDDGQEKLVAAMQGTMMVAPDVND